MRLFLTAGLAYLGMAGIVADLVLVRLLPESGEYAKQKTKEYGVQQKTIEDPGSIPMINRKQENPLESQRNIHSKAFNKIHPS